MTRRWLCGCVAACTLTLSLPAWAQVVAPARGLGEPVVSQSVAIEARPVADRALLELIETRVGTPLAASAVRESIAHLMGLGRFDDVVVSVAPAAGGVAVSYDLVPARAVGRVVFRGNVGVSERLLRDRIEERFGASFPLSRLDDLAPFLESVYHDQGYLQAKVTPRPDFAESSARDEVTVEVESGPRVTLTGVISEGNAPMALTTIPQRLGLAAGQHYRKADVDRKLEQLVSDLREQGYYEARADHQLRPGAQPGSALLAINVDGGARITVVFEGDPLSQKERRELVPIEREGSVDEDLLEDSANRIEGHLRAQGYRDADAEYERTPRDGGLAVVFKVRRGPQFRIARVTLAGTAAVPEAELRALLRTREGELFVEAALESDAATLAEQYRRRGYTQVRVEPVSVPAAGNTSPVPVDVRLTVTEGPRTVVGPITVAGHGAVDEAALRSAITSRTGQPYYQQQVALDRDGMSLVLLNRGYPSAVVDARVVFTQDRSSAAVAFVVAEGPQVFVEHVLVVGNVKTSAEMIRREVTLQPGAPLSYSELTESQRRISALGLFRRVRITELDHGEQNRRDLLVTVEEAPATTVGYGGGVEGGQRLRQTEPGGDATEVFEVAPRGFVEYARRNLFGRNQSISVFARASLRTRASTTAVAEGEEEPSGYTLRDYRLLGTYRLPRILGSSNDLLVTGFLEQGVRSSFNFARRGVRAELTRRLTRELSFSGRYVLERNELLEERLDEEDKPLLDRLFPDVRLSTLSAAVIRDTRDDPLAPTRGALVGWDNDLAARAIGSEIGFVKSFAQGFIYRRLPGRRATIVAAGARLGLARGFPHDVEVLDADNKPVLGPDGKPITEVVTDVPGSERFFAGGDTSVRGYALDRLGIPFQTIGANDFPTGGNAVLVLNAELRVPLFGGLGAVGFMDAGQVFNRVSDFDFGEIKPTAGLGLRYLSPIGPIRIDVGFKLDRGLLPSGTPERLTELHISLGQAF
jgi:outer membrane protein insertion porin family